MIDTFVLQGPVPGLCRNFRWYLGLFQQADEELWKNWLGLARAISYQTAYPNHSLETLATWNQRLSSSLLCDISHVELGIRNVISQALQSSGEKRGLRGHWLQDSSCYLSAIGGQEFDNHIEAAKRRALKTKSEALFDDIVAELSLGFWLTFLGKRYVAIHGDLASSLAGLKDRNVRRLSPLANRFRALRNRIAHHHRIFHRDLNRDWEAILDLSGLIHPALRDYLERTSETPNLILEFNQIVQARSSPNPHEPC